MSDASENLVRWRSRISKFEIDVVQSTRVKHMVTVALSGLLAKVSNKTGLNCKRFVLTLSSNTFENKEGPISKE